jgi:hypothetical protein
MRQRPAWVAALPVLLAAASTFVRADDSRKPPEDPAPGFLEFLGSVDGLADLNPEYLSQPDPPGTWTAAARTVPPPPPPPPPPNAAGVKNNDR